MATIKGAFKLPNGDILYPETSPDQIINLKNTILDESIYDIYTEASSGLSDQDIKDMLSEVLSYYNSVGTHAKLCRVWCDYDEQCLYVVSCGDSITGTGVVFAFFGEISGYGIYANNVWTLYKNNHTSVLRFI